MYESLIGLKLSDAQQHIAQSTVLATRKVVIQETAPPFTSKHRRPIFGEFRVLRVKSIAEDTLELLVARELLDEEIIAKDKRTFDN